MRAEARELQAIPAHALPSTRYDQRAIYRLQPRRHHAVMSSCARDDRNSIIRRIRGCAVVIGALFLTLSLGLAAVERHRAASNVHQMETAVFADLMPHIKHALRELESSAGRLSQDPVLLPAALTTAAGLKADRERLDEDLRSLSTWTEQLARLDQEVEKSLANARADERSKTVIRAQWTSLRRGWDQRLRL